MSSMSEIDLEREEMEEGRLLSADFGLSGPPAPAEVAPAPPRTVETVTLEIRTLQRQAQQIMLGYAVEIGRRLEEVKAILPHGQWGVKRTSLNRTLGKGCTVVTKLEKTSLSVHSN